MSAIFQSGYDRVNIRHHGVKFYASKIISFGRARHLKRLHKTATEALSYAQRFAARLERLLTNAQEKMEGHQ